MSVSLCQCLRQACSCHNPKVDGDWRSLRPAVEREDNDRSVGRYRFDAAVHCKWLQTAYLSPHLLCTCIRASDVTTPLSQSPGPAPQTVGGHSSGSREPHQDGDAGWRRRLEAKVGVFSGFSASTIARLNHQRSAFGTASFVNRQTIAPLDLIGLVYLEAPRTAFVGIHCRGHVWLYISLND